MAVRNLPEEEHLRKDLREVRNNLKRVIAEFDDSGLDINNLYMALRHQYSVIARLEDELDKVPTDDDLITEMETSAETEYSKIDHKEYTTIPTVFYNKLVNRCDRLAAKLSRVNILKELSHVNRLLGQNAGQQVQMEELRAKTEHIRIETHAAILQAMKDIFYLALRRMGKTDAELQTLAREMMRIEKDYPIIQEDYSKIKSRLFGQPEDVPRMIEARYEVMDDNVSRLNDIANSSVTRRAKRR